MVDQRERSTPNLTPEEFGKILNSKAQDHPGEAVLIHATTDDPEAREIVRYGRLPTDNDNGSSLYTLYKPDEVETYLLGNPANLDLSQLGWGECIVGNEKFQIGNDSKIKQTFVFGDENTTTWLAENKPELGEEIQRTL